MKGSFKAQISSYGTDTTPFKFDVKLSAEIQMQAELTEIKSRKVSILPPLGK